MSGLRPDPRLSGNRAKATSAHFEGSCQYVDTRNSIAIVHLPFLHRVPLGPQNALAEVGIRQDAPREGLAIPSGSRGRAMLPGKESM
jgi:hypothetical protein